MSVRLMSQVFDYVFPKRIGYEALVYPFKREKETWKIIERASEPVVRQLATTGSSCKAVLLALADHANDDGKGAYPSVTTLMRKTNLERPTVISAVLALQYHLFINFVGESPRETNNYDIATDRLVKPFDQGGKASLPVKVNPVYQGGKASLPEPSLTTREPSLDNDDVKNRTAELANLYAENIGAITPLIADLLRNMAIDYPTLSWYKPAFEIAVKNNVRTLNYLDAVLGGWAKHFFGWKPENKSTGPKKQNPQAEPQAMDSVRQWLEAKGA